MTSLVGLNAQMAQSKATIETSIKSQNEKNTLLEKELVAMKVQIRREQLIKELNTMKTVKKSDAIINQAMKDQSTAVAKEITDLKNNSGNLDKLIDDLTKQIQRTVPDQIHKKKSEIQLLKAQKAKATKEVQALKDQLGEVDIQDV